MEENKEQPLMMQTELILRNMNDSDLRKVINKATFLLAFGKGFVNKHYPL